PTPVVLIHAQGLQSRIFIESLYDILHKLAPLLWKRFHLCFGLENWRTCARFPLFSVFDWIDVSTTVL
ncbi:hypothetical protein, partial [Natrinema soli]